MQTMVTDPAWLEEARHAINTFMTWKEQTITAAASALHKEVPEFWTEGDAYMIQDLSDKSLKQIIDMFQMIAAGRMVMTDRTTNPMCVVHNYMRFTKKRERTVDTSRCLYCEYGKAHGVCLMDEGDETGIVWTFDPITSIIDGVISKRTARVVMKQLFSNLEKP